MKTTNLNSVWVVEGSALGQHTSPCCVFRFESVSLNTWEIVESSVAVDASCGTAVYQATGDGK